MFQTKKALKSAVYVTLVSMLIQVIGVNAEQSKRYETIIDVVLSSDGNLHGKVVNVSQEAMSESEVVVMQKDKVLVRTSTNNNGDFTINGLKQGVYKLTSADGVGYYRVWESSTAPPVAESHATLIAERQVVRGIAPAIIIGVIATAAIVGGAVAIANNDDEPDDNNASP